MSDVDLGRGRFVITGDASGATNAANQANNALAALSDQVNNGWWGLQNLGLAFAALPSAVAAGTGVAIKYAADWESAMLGVHRTTDLMGEDLEILESQLKAIAQTRPIAAVEVAGVAEAAGALGILETDIANFTSAVVDFSALTGMTTDAAATGLARIAALTNIAGSGYENLASAIFKAGVNTAATEEEIIGISTRLAGAASAVGLTADELVGLSAAIRSAGVRAEMGSTAVQKSFFDMNNAVSDGGKELQIWANLAGESAESFTEAFRGGNAMQMFVQVISSLGEMSAAGQDAIGVLNELGITEARQQQTLLVLAKAQNQTANANAQLTSALDYAREGLFDTTAAYDQATKRAQTFNGQVQILKNSIFLLGASFGESGGVAKAFVGFLADLVRGIQYIPGPIKVLIAVSGALVTAILGIGAAFLLIGPRAFLAAQSFQQLVGTIRMMRGEQTNAQTAIAGTNNALTQQQGSLEQTRMKWVQNKDAQGRFAAGGRYVAATIQQQNVALRQQAGILPGLRALWQNHAIAIRRATAAMGGMIAASIAMMYVTAKAGDAAEQAARKREKAAADNKRAIMEGLEAEKNGTKGAAQARLESLDSYQRAIALGKEFGDSHKHINSVIRGTVGIKEFNDWLDKISAQEENGSKKAAEYRRAVQDLQESFSGASSVFNVASGGLEDFESGLGAGTEAAEDQTEALRELANTLSQVAQAHRDYISAQFAAREAAFSLKDAEVELADARRTLANPSARIRDLEDAIAKARISQEQAAARVARAEVDLRRARQRGRDDLADAEYDLYRARDRYADGLEQIIELEEKLADLREGPSIDEITKATNKLRKAQLDLVGAHRKVSDAEWYLQHLREEGASQRDIEDAEYAIQVARQDAADTADDLKDAEKALADLTDPVKRAKDIQKAEQDLAAARRDSQRDLREIRRAEQELADIRTKVAQDGYYKDALRDLTSARLAERDAIRAVAAAERELEEFRIRGAAADAERAQLGYEQALYRVAEANMEAKRHQAAMRGEFWDSGDSARALAAELEALAAATPNKEARDRLLEFARTLRQAPEVPDVPRSVTPKVEPLDMGQIPQLGIDDFFEGGLPMEWPADAIDFGGEMDWKQWLLPIGAMILGALVSSLLTAAAGAASMATLTAALPYLIVAALVGGIVALFMNDEFRGDFIRGLERIWEWIQEWVIGLPQKVATLGINMWRIGSEWVQGMWNGFYEKFTEFFGAIGDWLYRNIVDPIKRVFGISSPSTVFFGIGADLIRGLWNGVVNIWNGFWGFLSGLPGQIIGVFLNAGTWLLNAGKNVIIGLKNGITSMFGSLWDGLGNLTSGIFNYFGNAGEWLVNSGKNLMIGLKNGITSMAGSVWDGVKGIGGGIVDGVTGFFGIRSPSKLFHYYGEMLSLGLANGLEGSGNAIKAAVKLAQGVETSLADNLHTGLRDLGLDYLLGPNGVGELRLDDSALSRMATSDGGQVINNYETLQLEAVTSADPAEIVNEYVWAKRVRLRGGV